MLLQYTGNTSIYIYYNMPISMYFHFVRTLLPQVRFELDSNIKKNNNNIVVIAFRIITRWLNWTLAKGEHIKHTNVFLSYTKREIRLSHKYLLMEFKSWTFLVDNADFLLDNFTVGNYFLVCFTSHNAWFMELNRLYRCIMPRWCSEQNDVSF